MNLSKIKYKYFIAALLGTLAISSCKKKVVTPIEYKEESKEPTTTTETTTTGTPPPSNKKTIEEKMKGVPNSGTDIEKSLDELYLAALNIYFWNNSLPDYTTFNPRQYAVGTPLETNLNNELFALTRYPINPNTSQSYEYLANRNQPKYSYLQAFDYTSLTGSFVPNTVSAVDLNGKGNDLGFSLSPILDHLNLEIDNTTKTHIGIYIKLVYPGSNAANNGLHRGDYITGINGTSFNSFFENKNDSQGLNNLIKGSLFNNNQTVTLTIYDKKNKSLKNVTINKTAYTSSPVLSYTVFTVGSKKVGYLAYKDFQILDLSQAELDKAFRYFEQNGANMEDFIFDIRYNGGGHVDAAEYIMNKWAAAQQNGKVMIKEYYNEDLKKKDITKLPYLTKILTLATDNNNTTTLQPLAEIDFSIDWNTLKFNSRKKSNLTNIKNIYYLVTGATASSAELTYNSMKPYANCVLIGEKTYGKPIGFFPIKINDFNVFLSLFESKNANNEGEYYDGIQANYQRADNYAYDFGDPNEHYIKTALNIIAGNSEPATEARRASSSSVIKLPDYIMPEKNPNYGTMIATPRIKR